jgi:hypothetical protein
MSDPFDDLRLDEDPFFADVRDPLLVSPDGIYPQIENVLLERNPYRDPFAGEMERYTRAGETPGGASDEFYQMLEARRERIKERNKGGKQVGNPPSAVEKRLGGNVTLTPDSNLVSKPVFLWEADDDAETGPCTVTFGMVTSPGIESGAVSALRPFAELFWGTYGNFLKAEVDIGRGTQLTVNASVVGVDLGLDAISVADATNPVNMSAFLSFRQCVRTAKLMRTKYIDSQATGAGNAVKITVPPFANFVLPVQMSDLNGVVQFDAIDSSGTIRFSLSINNGIQITPIPLTADIVQIKITTTSATTQHVRVPFELSI